MENQKLKFLNKQTMVCFLRTLFFKNRVHSESDALQDATLNKFHMSGNNWIFPLVSKIDKRLTILVFLFLASINMFGQIAQRGTATSGTSTTTSLVINVPTGVVEGDVMIANLAAYNNPGGSSITCPGWTQISQSGTGLSRGYSVLLYKVVTAASEPSSYTFTSDATSNFTGAIIAFSGVNPFSPFDVTPSTTISSYTPGGTPNFTVSAVTQVTTASANSAVLIFANTTRITSTTNTNFNGWAVATSPTLTELYDVGGNSANSAAVGAAWGIKATTGNTGTGSFNNPTNTNPRACGAQIIALRPAKVFYSKGSLAPQTAANWNTKRDGTGTNAVAGDFTTGSCFVIQNGHSMTTGGAWSVSGAGSAVEIESGGTLVATSAITLSAATTFQIDNGGTYKHQNATAFSTSIFQGTEVFGASSTVELNNSNTTGPTGVVFGNLIVNLTADPGGSVQLGGTVTTINGDFTIQNTNVREVRLTSGTSFTLNIAGDLIVSGGIMNFSSGSGVATINVAGDFIHTAGTITESSTGSGIIAMSGTASSTFQSTGQSNNVRITINKTGTATNDLVTLSADSRIDSNLTLTDGLLVLGNFNLTLGASTTITAPGTTASMIVPVGTGEIRRTTTATGSFVYPIGDNTGTLEYSPVTVNVTAGTGFTSAYIGVSLEDGKHSNNSSSTNFLTRSWKVNQSGITGCTATITGTYINSAADVSGTLGSINTAQLNGAFNQATNPWVKTGGNVLSGTTLTYTGAIITSGQQSIFTGITSADPTVSIAGGDVSVCIDASVTLTANPSGDETFTYLWSNSLGTSVTATPSTSTAGSTSYTVTVKDANGISSVASSAVTVTVSSSNTWTGSVSTSWTDAANWSCGLVPASGSNVTIASAAFYPQISSSVSVNSLTLNSGTTLKVNASYDLTVTDVITNNGTLTVENNANLIQTNNVANTGSGSTVVKRNSSAIMRLDYTLWSSPVTGQGLYAFSPFTFANRFYTYNSSSNTYSSVSGFNITGLNGSGVNGIDNNNVQFSTGVGYLIRMPNNHPATPTVWTGTFTGTPNNGDKTVTLSNTAPGFRFNLVGNPYPSPLNAIAFVEDPINAANITGALYFLRKTNGSLNSSYCSWTPDGFVTNNGAAVFDLNDVIQTGQGFFVEALPAGSTLQFNNAMRVSNQANQFFRSNNSVERNRIWLNVTNTSGLFSQTMVGYITNATNDVDSSKDAKYLADGDVALTSLIGSVPYAIQARALPFDSADVVPLSLKVATPGDYTISIDRVDGLFANNGQTVYLRDNTTGNVHNLSEGSYTFTSASGTFDSRFEVLYQAPLAITTPVFNEGQVVIYKTVTNELSINTGNVVMSSVQIFDVTGRLLTTEKNINASSILLKTGTSTEILLVQITSNEGVKVTKKVLFPKTALKTDAKVVVKTLIAEDE